MIALALAAALHSFTAGNDLYLRGDYTGAAAAYESAFAEDPSSPAIAYNLGNAYYKAGDLPRAVLSYEKTLRLAPRDADARANLRTAREHLSLSEEERVLVAASAGAQPIVGSVTLGEATAGFLSTYLPLTIFLFLALLSRDRWRRLWLGAAAACLVLSAVSGTLLLTKYLDDRARTGILLGPHVDLREGPEDAALPEGTASGGIRVRVLDTMGGAHDEGERQGAGPDGWFKVEVPGGAKGWVKGSSLGLI